MTHRNMLACLAVLSSFLVACNKGPGGRPHPPGTTTTDTDTTLTSPTGTDTGTTALTAWAEPERHGVPRFYPIAYPIVDFGWDGRFAIGLNCLMAADDPRGIASPDPYACVEQPDGSGQVQSWTAHVLRPETLDTDERGFPNVFEGDNRAYISNDGALQPLALIEASRIVGGDGVPPYEPPSGVIGKLLSISITVDPDYTVNPYRSDAQGNADSTGAYETYKALLYHGMSDIEPEHTEDIPRHVGVSRLTLVVSDPRTAAAAVESASLDGHYEPLIDTNGDLVLAGEITATGDGRLILYHGDVDNESAIQSSINYTFHETAGSSTGWSVPKNVAEMYYEDRDREIAGVAFHELYPLAREPLRDYQGEPFDRNRPFSGAYPWITRDGTDFSFSAFGAEAASIVGEFTGYHMRLMDGPMNPTRIADRINGLPPRNQIHSPGMTSTMWHPYLDVAEQLIPSMPRQYVMPLVGSGSQYADVSFDEFMDGDYLVYLNMNELLQTWGLDVSPDPRELGTWGYAFLDDATPDTSGNLTVDGGVRQRTANLHHGQLVGGASFPLEAEYLDQEVLDRQAEFGIVVHTDLSEFPPEERDRIEGENYDRMIGMHGQGILVPGSGAVRVTHTAVMEELSDQLTVELFVKLLGTDVIAMDLVRKGSFDLTLANDGTVSFEVTTEDGTQSVTSSYSLPTEQWVHVAGVFDGAADSPSVSLYFDGTQVGTQSASGTLVADTDDLTIGPNGSADGEDWLAILDEFGLSRVARSALELQAHAYVVPDHGLLSAADADRDDYTDLIPEALPTSQVYLPEEPGYPDDAFWSVRDLGELIFRDTGLSKDGERSCAGCHLSDLAFTDGKTLAEGLEGKELSLNTPTIVNRAMGTRQFLDGRAASVEDQAVMPITNPDEMGMAMSDVLNRLQTADYYNETADSSGANLFQTIWGAPATEDHLKTALGLYVRTIFTGSSRVDDYEAGDLSALTEAEVTGRGIFFGKGRCVSCHNGPNYSDERFHATGLTEDSEELGRHDVTGRNRDRFAIKTPTLRELTKTAPYFHDGSAEDLARVVELYNDGPIPGREASVQMFPLGLTAQEQADLVAFLEALSSE